MTKEVSSSFRYGMLAELLIQVCMESMYILIHHELMYSISYKQYVLFFILLRMVSSCVSIAYQPGGVAPISSSNKRLTGNRLILPSGKERSECSQPRALTLEEIPKIIDDFRSAARNAVRAGMFFTYTCTNILRSPTWCTHTSFHHLRHIPASLHPSYHIISYPWYHVIIKSTLYVP